MLSDYLEENPGDARIIVQKVILAAQARHAAKKQVNWFREKLSCMEAVYRVNFLIVPGAILKNVKFFWLREIPQVELQNRAVTEISRLYCHFGVRS